MVVIFLVFKENFIFFMAANSVIAVPVYIPLDSIYNIKGSSFHAFLQVYIVCFLDDSEVNVLVPMCCFPTIIGHQCFFSGELHSVLQSIC